MEKKEKAETENSYHFLPTPEGPIGKRDVKVRLGGAIAEQRQRQRPMFCPVNTRLVHTIKHHINVRNHPWVPPQKLQQPPDRERRSALHARVVQIDEQSAPDDHGPERREFSGLLQVGRRDSGPVPGLEILVDPPEELGAFVSGRIGFVATAFRIGGVAAAGEVGAVQDLVDARVARLLGEGLGREEVPRRWLQVVPHDGLGLRSEVVHLIVETPKRVRTEWKNKQKNGEMK